MADLKNKTASAFSSNGGRCLPDQPLMSLGILLRQSRTAKGLSQLDLALRLDVSQRHICHLERERARPSRRLLLAWMDEVKASLQVRNDALLRANFAPICDDLNGEGLFPTRASLVASQILDAHSPFPAMSVTADLTIVELNRGAQWLFSAIMPEIWGAVANAGAGLNMIDLLTAPGGIFSRMRNAKEASLALLRELRAKAWGVPALQGRVDGLSEWIEQKFGVTAPRRDLPPGALHLNQTFDTAHGPLSFITTQGLFGLLPQDLSTSSLRVKLWFPSDSFTRSTTERLAEAGDARVAAKSVTSLSHHPILAAVG